jgi:hypothetical protein
LCGPRHNFVAVFAAEAADQTVGVLFLVVLSTATAIWWMIIRRRQSWWFELSQQRSVVSARGNK